MTISEPEITAVILEAYLEKLKGCLSLDAAIVGAGPSGLVVAHDLARAGLKVALFERKLSPGGGLWGGGMLFNVALFQPEAAPILREFGIRYETRTAAVPSLAAGAASKGTGAAAQYLAADAVQTAAVLIAKALEAGALLFNGIHVEDLMVRDGVAPATKTVSGLVINWSSVEIARLHVDPMALAARATVDATGHECSLARFAVNKGLKLGTPTGGIVGEKMMWAERGEEQVVEMAGEVCPGLYAAGMAASAIFGGYRMGPIFGGMLLSGRKLAQALAEKLSSGRR